MATLFAFFCLWFTFKCVKSVLKFLFGSNDKKPHAWHEDGFDGCAFNTAYNKVAVCLGYCSAKEVRAATPYVAVLQNLISDPRCGQVYREQAQSAIKAYYMKIR